MSVPDSPPPVLAMARVLAYAILDESVLWTGKQKHFVGDKELGPVPRLALCQNVRGDDKDILILHCDDEWEVLGAGGAATLDEAKARAERAYQGVGTKWVEMNVSIEEATAWIRENFADVICSFCGRLPPETDGLITGKSGAICNACIDELHALIHPTPGDPT